MKKLLITLTFILSFSQSEAQFLKNIGKKLTDNLERNVERRVEKKADKTADKALDPVFEPSKKTKKQKRKRGDKKDRKENNIEGLGDFGDLMNMVSKEVTTEDQYMFHTIITTNQYSKKKNTQSVTQYLGNTAILIETNNSKMLIDNKNNASITFKEEKKEAQVISLDILQALDGMAGNTNNSEEEVMPVITNIGTKKIMGYTCKGINIKSEDTIVDLWHTDEVEVDASALKDFLSKMPNVSKKAMEESISKKYGFVMQMDVTKLDKTPVYGTKVTKIEKTLFTLKMNDYKLIKSQ